MGLEHATSASLYDPDDIQAGAECPPSDGCKGRAGQTTDRSEAIDAPAPGHAADFPCTPLLPSLPCETARARPDNPGGPLMKNLLAALSLALAVGCGGKDNDRQPKDGKPAAIDGGDRPPLTAAEKEFNDRLSDFVKEARGVGRMLDTEPDPAPSRKRLDGLGEWLTRIPDGADDLQKAYREFARRVSASLGAGEVYIRRRDDFLKMGARDEARKVDEKCKDLGEKVLRHLDELEAAVREGTQPPSPEDVDEKGG